MRNTARKQIMQECFLAEQQKRKKMRKILFNKNIQFCDHWNVYLFIDCKTDVYLYVGRRENRRSKDSQIDFECFV